MTNPTRNSQKRKRQTGPSSTKPKKAIKERRTQPETTVDLTGPAENSPPSPSPTTASDTSVGDPTVGAPTVKKKKSGAGRPKDSPIWTFFRHDEEDKSVCLSRGRMLDQA
ncbi:hypothetical protein RvY_02376 [Ramazzottius varieornatus]|uniref:Uncharacterized protein n=1 Tax=Ramazzottius varieornatus TaxID=947166 RepID=A0A1D1URK2_RAMVA|nr:hypothetical protein RvY_02376 [Ramazzottius varieornatus]